MVTDVLKTPTISLLVSEREAARLLDCSEKTLLRMRKDRQLKFVRVRGSIKYARAEITRFINEQMSHTNN